MVGLVRGHIRDRRVEHPAIDSARQVSNQPGPDDGTVGLVDEAAERTDLRILAVGGRGHFRGSYAADDERGATDARTGEGPEPQSELDHIPFDRDPLGFGFGGNQLTVDTRAELDTRRVELGEAEGEVERWRPVAGIAKSSGAVATGGVEVDTIDTGEIDLFCSRMLDARVRPWSQVVCGDGRGDLVALHRGHLELQCGDGEGIRPDAAPEIRHPLDAGVGEASGMVGRHAEPGGLFEPGFGEQHPFSE